jgi:hypothetical protein
MHGIEIHGDANLPSEVSNTLADAAQRAAFVLIGTYTSQHATFYLWPKGDEFGSVDRRGSLRKLIEGSREFTVFQPVRL